MKPQNNKSIFLKQTIVELNDYNLLKVSGGSTPVCAFVGSVGVSFAIANAILKDED